MTLIANHGHLSQTFLEPVEPNNSPKTSPAKFTYYKMGDKTSSSEAMSSGLVYYNEKSDGAYMKSVDDICLRNMDVSCVMIWTERTNN
mmetsp:Transcript_20748/g.37692  ORF Transcript_20748/g.37692 Transcript_20748/m.37692 type:complete len:88 (-) Transcript_20748:203-466(-)